MFRRDASGPMDVDSVHPLGRAAEYALPDDGPAKKRPHSDLSSPSPFANPSHTPAFRFGPNTPFLFHAPPLPPTPKFEPYDPNKWARTDFGFGTSAAHVDDVDMDGGEGSGEGAPPESPRAHKPTKKQSKSARVEDAEEKGEERKIATGAVTRARRRRRQWNQKDDGVSRSEHTYNVHMGPQGTRHTEVPAILLGYVQFVFNGSLVIGFLYIATQFILAVRRDVQERIEEASVEILQEIAECSRSYMTNRCEANQRVPAMEVACQAWELCMNRDPKVVGRARVGAETFAGVINSFVDPISWKTMGFTVVTLSLLILLTNSALFNLRAKHQHAPLPPREPQYPPWMYQGQLGPGMIPPAQGLMAPGSEYVEKEPQGVAGKALAWLKK